MNGKTIGYVRTSTITQNEKRQLIGIKLDKIFIDKCSGKDKNRPQLQLMLEFVREDDIVIIHSMDRLARNLSDLRHLVDTLTSKGVKFKFLKENLIFTGKSDNSISHLMLGIIGSIAEFERNLINERIREGIAIAKQAGRYKGRKPSLNLEQIVELKRLVAERYNKTKLAKHFGISRDTLYRYLKSQNNSD